MPHKLRDVVDDASPHGGRLAGRGGGDRAVDAHEKGSDGRRGDASGSYRDRGVRAGGDEVELVVRPRREGTPSASAHFVSIKESTAAAPGGFTLGRSRVSSRSRSVSAGIEYTSPSIPPARLTVARYPAAPIERPVKCRFGGKTRLAPSWQSHGHKQTEEAAAAESDTRFRLIFGLFLAFPSRHRRRGGRDVFTPRHLTYNAPEYRYPAVENISTADRARKGARDVVVLVAGIAKRIMRERLISANSALNARCGPRAFNGAVRLLNDPTARRREIIVSPRATTTTAKSVSRPRRPRRRRRSGTARRAPKPRRRRLAPPPPPPSTASRRIDPASSRRRRRRRRPCPRPCAA